MCIMLLKFLSYVNIHICLIYISDKEVETSINKYVCALVLKTLNYQPDQTFQ